LDSKGIVEIIKAAKNSGVTALKYGELHIEFESLTAIQTNIENSSTSLVLSPNEVETIETSEFEAVTEDYMDFNLLADDPEAYERQKLQKDLNARR
jgi:hypothetical protein